jgi:hypothetical protein
MGKRPPLRQDTKAHQSRLAHYGRLYPDSDLTFIQGYVAFVEGYALSDHPKKNTKEWTKGWIQAATDALKEAA